MTVEKHFAPELSAGKLGPIAGHPYFVEDNEDETGFITIPERYHKLSSYPDFLPTWDRKEKDPPYEFFEYEDPGTRVKDTLLPNLFPNDKKEEIKVTKLSPKLGSEITGLQLSSLIDNDKAKDELAYLIAKRGVLIFRDQDLASKGPKFAAKLVEYFGPLHTHQTSGHPKDVKEIHVVYRRPIEEDYAVVREIAGRRSWHSDITFELQPASYTFFLNIDSPGSGGDTLFADTVEAYKRLSPKFREFLETLSVVHTGKDQAQFSGIKGGIIRREPVENVHPLVREHPVLKEKVLFVNQGFSRRIVGLKRGESDVLLDFLTRLVENTHDLQIRAHHTPGSVVIWDNRRTQHAITLDFDKPVLRHLARVTATGERPVVDLKYLNDINYKP